MRAQSKIVFSVGKLKFRLFKLISHNLKSVSNLNIDNLKIR